MAKRKAGRLAKRTSATPSRAGKRPSAKAKSRKKSGKKPALAKKRGPAARKPAAAKRRPAARKRVIARKLKPAARKGSPAVRTKPAVRKVAIKKVPSPKAASTRPAPPKASPKLDTGPGPGHTSRVERERRVLSDVVQTPPSSLDMDRHGSAARTGRAEMAQHAAEHATMTPDITGGDVDLNTEDAYFTGDGAPGGDNPTPDQDRVDDFGKALGVEYQDSEELRSSDKVADRDKHRWELDPASAEDYRERKR